MDLTSDAVGVAASVELDEARPLPSVGRRANRAARPVTVAGQGSSVVHSSPHADGDPEAADGGPAEARSTALLGHSRLSLQCPYADEVLDGIVTVFEALDLAPELGELNGNARRHGGFERSIDADEGVVESSQRRGDERCWPAPAGCDVVRRLVSGRGVSIGGSNAPLLPRPGPSQCQHENSGRRPHPDGPHMVDDEPHHDCDEKGQRPERRRLHRAIMRPDAENGQTYVAGDRRAMIETCPPGSATPTCFRRVASAPWS